MRKTGRSLTALVFGRRLIGQTSLLASAFALSCASRPTDISFQATEHEIPRQDLWSVTHAITLPDGSVLVGGNYKDPNWMGRILKGGGDAWIRCDPDCNRVNSCFVRLNDRILVFWGERSICAAESRDGGDHWKELAGLGEISGSEPSALLCRDGSVLVAFESKVGRDDDDGEFRSIRTAVFDPATNSWTRPIERKECWTGAGTVAGHNFEDAHLTRLNSKDLLLTFEEEAVPKLEDASSVWFLRSSDEGRTWSPPRRIAGGDGYNNDGPKMLKLGGKEIICFWLRSTPESGDAHEAHLACRRSNDNGKNWLEIQEVTDGFGNVGLTESDETEPILFYSTSEPPKEFLSLAVRKQIKLTRTARRGPSVDN